RTTRPSFGPSVASRSLNSGNSARHGVHQDAQKFTTTGWPLYCARSKVWPSSVVPVIGGAGWPVWAPPEPPHAAATSTAMARRAGSRRRAPAMPARTRGGRNGWITIPPSVGGLPDVQRPRHRRMDRADELVGARREGVDLVHDGGRPGHDLAHEQLRPGGVVNRDVVRRPAVLVVEADRERLPGRGADLLLLER